MTTLALTRLNVRPNVQRYQIIQPTEVEQRFDNGDVAAVAQVLAARSGRLLTLRRALYLPKEAALTTLGVPDVDTLMSGDLWEYGVGPTRARALHVAREAVWQLRALKAKGDKSQVKRVGHDHMRACGIDEGMIDSWRRDGFLLESEHPGFYWQTQSFRSAFHDETSIRWSPDADEIAQIMTHAEMLLDSLSGFAREVVIALRDAALAGEYTMIGTVRQGLAMLRALGHLAAREDTVRNHREDSHSFHQVAKCERRFGCAFVEKGYFETWVFLPRSHLRGARNGLGTGAVGAKEADNLSEQDGVVEPRPNAEASMVEPQAETPARLSTVPAHWNSLRGRLVDFNEALGVVGVSRATLTILAREHWIRGARGGADEGITFDGTLLYEWLLNRG